jgi:hypothetical protein
VPASCRHITGAIVQRHRSFVERNDSAAERLFASGEPSENSVCGNKLAVTRSGECKVCTIIRGVVDLDRQARRSVE